MKKRIVILLICLVFLMSTLSGCRKVLTAVKAVKGIREKETETSEEVADSNGGAYDTVPGLQVVQAVDDEEAWGNSGEDVSSEEETSEEEPSEEMSHGEEHYNMCMERFNSTAPDLSVRIGEFLTETDGEESDIMEDKKGKKYGYEADYTSLCSVWCVVTDFEENAYATSELDPVGNNSYEARNIISHDRDNAWVEGVAGDGIGESITITKRYGRDGDYENWDCFFFTDICIVNGLAKSEDLWKKNGRVKTLRMYFNDEYICDLQLQDTMKPQYISLYGLNLSAANYEESSFRFEIADVYKGTKYDDTCITGIEIEFYTENH